MFKYCVKLAATFGKLGNCSPGFKLSSNMSKPHFLHSGKVVWIDMEMSGLDVDNDSIMEVACLVTDSDLDIIAEGPSLVLHLPDIILNNMSEWCMKQHKTSGLIEASRNSTLSLEEAEEELLNFISTHVVRNSSPLAGNSVYMDRLFLRKHMPRVNNYLHYRIIDVSSIKELCRMWRPQLYQKVPAKAFQHRALNDIKESVQELKFYKNNFFRAE